MTTPAAGLTASIQRGTGQCGCGEVISEWPMDGLNIKGGRWLQLIFAWALIASYALFLLVYCLVAYLVFPRHMQENIEQRLPSPDGRYTAVLRYEYAMGYADEKSYHVTLEHPSGGWFRHPDEVTEVDATDVDGEHWLHLDWGAPQTLIVRYSDLFAAEKFVVREGRWHGVKIRYESR